MLLNKQNLSIVKFVSDYDNRPALQCLHITSDYTEACDGRTLVRVTIDKNLKDEEFPSIKPFAISKKQQSEVLLNADAVRQALNHIPVPDESIVHITTNALLDAPKSDKPAVLYTTDMNTIQANTSRVLPDVTYPSTDEVIPQNRPFLHLRFNGRRLIALLEILKDCADYDLDGGIYLLFHDCPNGEKQLAIKAKTELGQQFYALLMPMKLDDDEREDRVQESDG